MFGAVIALVAMLLVPAPAAFAAPGDFAFGVVTVDANQNNVLDAIGVAGTQDQPLAGATVTLRAADAPADHPGWTTTTGATGAWAFADDGEWATGFSGPYTVGLDVTGVAGDVYAVHTATSADNAFASVAAQNQIAATAEFTAADAASEPVELNALVWPTWKLDLQLPNDPDGFGGQAVRTGTIPFDANDMEPGFDSGFANDRVRSGDTVSYVWNLTASYEEPLADGAATVIFEQVLELEPGARANFVRIPAICTGTSPASSIVAWPSGTVLADHTTAPDATLPAPPAGTTEVVLSCSLGEMGVGDAVKQIAPVVKTLADSHNGATFSTTARAYGVDPAGSGAATVQPTGGLENGPIEITAAMRWDLQKHRMFATGNYVTRTIDGVPTLGYTFAYPVTISTDRRVGAEPFAQPVTFSDFLWAEQPQLPGDPVMADLKYYVTECGPNSGLSGSYLIGNYSTTSPEQSVRGSGVCSFERSDENDPTSHYDFSISGVNLSGDHFPTRTQTGVDLTNGPYYVASHRISIFIPATELDRADGVIGNSAGQLRMFNLVSEFDPVGVGGTPNFGSGVEPGYCATPGLNAEGNPGCALMEDGARSNNISGPNVIQMGTPGLGTFHKRLFRQPFAWNNSNTARLHGQSADHDGLGVVQPGTVYNSRIAAQTQDVTWSGTVGLCDVFDRSTVRLAPLNAVTGLSNSGQYSDDLYAYVHHSTAAHSQAAQQPLQANWAFQYAAVDVGGDTANTGVFHEASGRYNGVWAAQRAVNCGDSGIQWFASPAEVPGGIDAVNAVRAVSTDVSYGPSTVLSLIIALEQRDTFNGGPNDGQFISEGTVVANYGQATSDMFRPGWQLVRNYVPQPETTHDDGDRWTVQRADASIKQRTIQVDGVGAGQAGVDTTGVALAGQPVIWEMLPVLTALNPDAGIVRNIVVTETLPAGVTYSDAQTAALTGGTPAHSSVVNPDGTTTLTWNLGDLVPNQPIPSLIIYTETDPLLADGGSFVSTARISGDGLLTIAAHTDTHTVIIEQTGQMQLRKSVDHTLDLQDDEQHYVLEVKSFSEVLPVAAPTVYEVLPYNGDALNAANVNRLPASNFAGTSHLLTAPQAFDFGRVNEKPGTFYYTTIAPASIPQHIDADTDPSIWSTTLPPLDGITGFKFVASESLGVVSEGEKSGMAITFATTQSNNNPGALYANRFTAFSPTFESGGHHQLLTSNQTTVRVIGFSLGDFIWLDVDGDGAYTTGTDRPAPAGVTVQVRDADDAVVATTTTLGGAQQGRWVVNDLAEGEYYVTIPASQFAAGGPLEGTVSAPAAVADPNSDTNEVVDHHAIADGAGVRSSGLITLSADTDVDPIAGEEPLGDNVAGLTLSPLTTDDFTNLTLDLALTPAVPFTVMKVIAGAGAQHHVDTEFAIEVTCTLDDAAVPGYPKTVTLTGGGAASMLAPMGADCVAVETDDGGATSSSIDPEDGVTLTFEPVEPFTMTVTNTFDVGSFSILKELDGVGVGLSSTYAFEFTAVCTYQGEEVFDELVVLSGDGSAPLESDPFDGLPVGAECVITETDTGGADETPAPVQIVIDADPDTVQVAGFINEFSAGTVEVSKTLAGDAADNAFVQDLTFEVLVTCQVDRAGTLVDVFGGAVALTGGETVAVEVGGQPVLLPLGTHCFGEETGAQGASAAVVDFDSYDNAAIVESGNVDEPQQLTVTANNTFEMASLTVSKSVVGPAPAVAEYQFAMACTYSGDGDATDYPLADEDAQFTLRHGESRTIAVLSGVDCEVVETNVPADAVVTVVDSDATTAGGVSDGEVTDLHGDENAGAVTNTFHKGPVVPGDPGDPAVPATPGGSGPLSTTGGVVLTAGLVVAGLLLLAGAVILIARRRHPKAPQDAVPEHH